MPPVAIAIATVASTAASLSQINKGSSRPIAGPKPPTFANPDVQAAAQRRLKANLGKGRRGTILTGNSVSRQPLETESSTILGGLQ